MENSQLSVILENLKRCPDKEDQQGYLRFVLVSLVSFYIFVLTLIPQVTFEEENKETVRQAILIVYPLFASYSLVFFYWLYRMPVEVPIRRVLSNFVDLLSLSLVMHFSNEWGSVLYPIYLWIIVGSGFRFGLKYLMISTVFSALMFSIVIFSTPFWFENSIISVGLFLGLFILSPYLGFLLKQKDESLRQIREASIYKERFLAAVSHELRTPLQSIIGLSGLSLEDSHRDDLPKYLDRINSAAQHLLVLINNVLDFSKLDRTNALVLNTLSFNTREMIATIKTLMLFQAESKHLVFEVNVDDNIPDVVIGDELRIRQVLINLLSNAVKYTESGKVIFAVYVLDLNKKSVQLRFSIEDTGIGIKEDDLDKVFRSFIQVNSNGSQVSSGLGLAISRQLVELMGSTITVASERGRGSRFAFDLELLLPVSEDQGQGQGRGQGQVKVSGDSLAGLRILVAEDESLLHYTYEKAFRGKGCELTIIGNGEAALQALREQSYDLAIVDNQMPILSGLELAQIWRREEQGRLPMIFLTADVMVLGKDKNNFDLVRIKPINPSELIKDVRYLVDSVSR